MIGALAGAALAVVLLAPTGELPATPPTVPTAKTDPGQTGIAPSAYRGKYYRAGHEPYRKCVAQREGRGQYWGTGSNGMYLGTYQMTVGLTRGAVWMMTKELRAFYGDKRGKELRDQLFNTKPTRWHRFYWDMAFYTVLNWERDGRGVGHWRGGRFSCSLGMQASHG